MQCWLILKLLQYGAYAPAQDACESVSAVEPEQVDQPDDSSSVPNIVDGRGPLSAWVSISSDYTRGLIVDALRRRRHIFTFLANNDLDAPTAAAVAAVSTPAIPASSSAATSSSSASPSKFAPSITSQCNTLGDFARLRTELRAYGVDKLKEDMTQAGWFVQEGEPVVLSTADKPMNPFSRLVVGKLPAPDGNLLQQHGLLEADKQFLIAQNRPELDAAWASTDPSMIGRASMSKHHQFLLLRSLRWDWFNAATWGIGGEADEIQAAIQLVDQMTQTAHAYTQKAGWSNQLGLFVHCYPFNSVNAFHLHMVDLACTGPTYEALHFKNLPLSLVRRHLVSSLHTASLPWPINLHFCEFERIDWGSGLSGDTAKDGSTGPLIVASYPVRKGLIRKAQLAFLLRKYCAKRPQSILHRTFPETHLMCVDDAEYLEEALNDVYEVRDMVPGRDMWIMKASMVNRAMGIHLIACVEDVERIVTDPQYEEIREWVMQRYIQRPLLVNGCKFHVRVYCLAVGNLKVYMWDQMLVRHMTHRNAPHSCHFVLPLSPSPPLLAARVHSYDDQLHSSASATPLKTNKTYQK
jgi:hypothetical protein